MHIVVNFVFVRLSDVLTFCVFYAFYSFFAFYMHKKHLSDSRLFNVFTLFILFILFILFFFFFFCACEITLITSFTILLPSMNDFVKTKIKFRKQHLYKNGYKDNDYNMLQEAINEVSKIISKR